MTTITYPNATLKIADTTTPTTNVSITEESVAVNGSSFGTSYSNTALPYRTTVTNTAETQITKIEPSSIGLTHKTSGDNLTASLGFSNVPTLTLIKTSPLDPPEFPERRLNMTTSTLQVINSDGWNVDISKLKLDGNLSTEGQVITANANGRPIWGSLPTMPTPIVSTADIYISTINPAFQYPPALPPSAIINTYQYYGWYFINSVASRKIDWYLPPSKNMLVSSILGLYMNFFNITTTDPQNLPFISVYTVPTGINDAIPGFAHSVMVYSLYDGLPINPFLPVANTPYCAFMNKSGVQPTPFAYGHTIQNMLISPTPNNPRGEYLPTETVAYISVGSNSTSPVNQVNFVMSKVGICLANGNQEQMLIPQNILDFQSSTITATTSVKPTTILDLNNQAGTAGQVLSSTGTGIDWVDNPTPYISSSGVASGGITSLPSINAVGAMTIGEDVATTGLTIGRSGYNTTMGGNLAMGGNDITGVDAIDGNSASLSIGTGAGTTSSVIIGKAGIAVDLVNTVRVGASGSLSSGSAGDVVTSQGSGQPTIYKATTLSTVIGGYLAPNAGQSQYSRIRVTTITPPIVGAKYMFIFNGGFTNVTVGDVRQRLVLCTTAGTVASPTNAQSINVINSLAISTTPPDELTSLAICRVPTLFTFNQNFIYVYTSTGTTAITFSVWAYSVDSNTLGLKNHNFDVIRIA